MGKLIRLLALSLVAAITACSSASTEVPSSSLKYENPDLGFAVDYPSDWQVMEPTSEPGPGLRTWSKVSFISNLYAYGEQVFGRYQVDVEVTDALGKTLAETVDYELSAIMPGFRSQIGRSCCLTVDGQLALELTNLPGYRWGVRRIVLVYGARVYRLSFYPQQSLSSGKPSDVRAQAEFEAFLHSFDLPLYPPPQMPTPSGTPTAVPTPRCSGHRSTHVLTQAPVRCKSRPARQSRWTGLFVTQEGRWCLGFIS